MWLLIQRAQKKPAREWRAVQGLNTIISLWLINASPFWAISLDKRKPGLSKSLNGPGRATTYRGISNYPEDQSTRLCGYAYWTEVTLLHYIFGLISRRGVKGCCGSGTHAD